MSSAAELIKKMVAIEYDKYASVSSREKLVVYAISYLRDHSIPLSFNNICIATFKLFPEKFYFSEEFKEYPHIEMLNRTILHLRPLERNYASGSVRSDYRLTQIGEEVAKQVATELEDPSRGPVNKQIMDKHKKTSVNEFNKIKNSDLFKKWVENNEVEDMDIWSFFEVTPYTQISKIQKFIKENIDFAKDQNEDKVVELLRFIDQKIS